MKLVVDTNVLLTFFWQSSVARVVFSDQHIGLCAPEFALEEIKKHESELMKKAKLSPVHFNQMRKEMAMLVEFIPLAEYRSFLETARSITPDPDDIDFVALSLKFQCPIWSNDHALANQNHFKVCATKEIIELLAMQRMDDD
ncbi:hypothetical protein HY490_02745 [Candidatus Woesearchaeota archaeon]|nr:hypothetical protein [Candidatus Woesearchaeota archaeon]